MKIQFDAGGTGQNFIHAYGPGQVTINQQVHRRSLLVTSGQLITDWPPQSFGELLAQHFEQIRALNPEVVVLGTGARLQFPRTADTRALIQANIGLEVMDTGAACRTYNILMQDGRRVAAALLMIES
ncbi:MAG TPA: Mth938-like domain-containing protein [Burkholderiales bacterium]|nr:Mth938-like domain-containing protein [Burkholderiales bacterium]